MRIMATHGLVHHDALNFKVVNFLKPNQPNASKKIPVAHHFCMYNQMLEILTNITWVGIKVLIGVF